MHRGGGSAGGAAGGGIVGGAGGSHRALELEHPSAMPGAPGFHWGAMFAGHHAAAAAGMMQPPMSTGGEYVPTAAHHGPAHPAMPMDLHVHQGFPYFPTRCGSADKNRLLIPPPPPPPPPPSFKRDCIVIKSRKYILMQHTICLSNLRNILLTYLYLSERATRNCSSDTSRYLDNTLKLTVRLMLGLQLAAGSINWYSNTGSSLRNEDVAFGTSCGIVSARLSASNGRAQASRASKSDGCLALLKRISYISQARSARRLDHRRSSCARSLARVQLRGVILK
ncbi:hypothetical protein ALC60_07118 [Trachymyrmex zeteki]|uniref:Uncharacterized protein n=1 Tax=Mycetomoellerius zeteki TaxID=64791 RepID=A0A151X0R5_9HYME|nr:hypothetical protein ALC60_07118 [Trachymyrmex zeteki]